MSKRYSINTADLKSMGITLLMVAVSAAVAQAIEMVPSINFGENSEFIILVMMAILKGAQKFLSGKP
jgi:hypothetical protein